MAQITEAVRRAHQGDSLVYGEQLATMVDGVILRSEEAEDRWAKLKLSVAWAAGG